MWAGKFLAALASLFGVTANVSAQTQKRELKPLLAMVALEDGNHGNAQAVAAYVNEHWKLSGTFQADEAEAGPHVQSFTAPDGALLFVTYVDLPIPQEDLQFPCETSMGWDDACSELKRMKGHAIVAIFSAGHMSAASQTFFVSVLAQSVAAQSKAIGVYLGESDSVWSAKQWEAMTLNSSEDQPPYLPWIGLKAQPNGDGTVSAVTRGMTNFGLMNVEVQNSTRDGNDVLEFLVDTATYLVSSGDVIKDGDTIGASADEKIKVSYGPSLLDPTATVYQLHY